MSASESIISVRDRVELQLARVERRTSPRAIDFTARMAAIQSLAAEHAVTTPRRRSAAR